MSIVTKTGDSGLTGLMYNKRVSKCDPRVEAYGALDELNASLGLARASASDSNLRNKLLAIQKDLVALMGELATLPEDLSRYFKDGFEAVTPAFTMKLEEWIDQIEAQKISFKGWATPGETFHSAALDLARTAARRAERRVWALHEVGGVPNHDILVYLNRLSDLLWLFARWVETQPPGAETGGNKM
jgi:cob(I)alamin adenosyltransferase